MATEDISRNGTSPRKRYEGIRLQQGRVTTDDDYNEGARLDAEHGRQTTLDIIGPSGSPDGGFAIRNPRLNAKGDLDFDIGAGTLYLGGLRLECFGETYAQQVDWLEQQPTDRAAPADGRADLIYVMAWEQPVEAIEDSELFETALGGPDTATRVRLMRRMMLGAGLGGDDCASAWTGELKQIEATYGPWNPASGLCEPDTKLQVTFDNTGKKNDLCSPSVVGGYLGAENQAIRVQIVDSGHFTWGFDNASPLFRVAVAADNQTVTLQTEPKDQAHWMQAGQTVEILAWSSLLPNGEKLAEISGYLTTVAGAYDPDLHTLTLANPLPAQFGTQWQGRGDLAAATTYFFMRVWPRGSDTTSPSAIAFAAGTPVALGNTGVLVTLTGSVFVPGDYWVIAARPEAPTRAVPWELLDGRAPHGIRRFFTPIGQISWSVSNGNTTGKIDDCRTPFQPLTQRDTCCTFTVGDGVTTHGDYTVIQDAIDHLPPRGGCLCILAGTYAQDFRVDGLQSLRIEGCGPRTKIVGAAGSKQSAVVTIADSSAIVLTDLAITNAQRIPLQLVDRLEAQALNLPPDLAGVQAPASKATGRPRLGDIHLHHLTIESRDLSAVVMAGGRFIDLTESAITADLVADVAANSPSGHWPAVFIAADDVLVERNTIKAQSLTKTPLSTFMGVAAYTNQAAASMIRSRLAMGGIQVAGGSERIAIRRNRIIGGNGNGITLGSIAYVPATALNQFAKDHDFLGLTKQWAYAGLDGHLTVGENGCIQYVPNPPSPNDPNGAPQIPVSTGHLTDILIKENEITGMGQAGIGVAMLFDGSSSQQSIIVDRLAIRQNRINHCLQIELPEINGSLAGWAAYGAIALAIVTDLQISSNAIVDNGRSHLQPICGIFLLAGTGVAIENNTIRDNGPRINSAGTAQPGLRGGIFLGFVTAPGEDSGPEARPAARLFDNVVVCEDGQALVIVAACGAVSIHRNSLTSRGASAFSVAADALSGKAPSTGLAQSFLQLGAAVVVLDLGISSEMATTGSFTNARFASLQAAPVILPRGAVMFDNNQVLLEMAGGRAPLVVSSVTLISLDDVSAQANQLSAWTGGMLLLSDLLIVAGSFRMIGNRMSETQAGCLLSGIGFGVLRTVALNQSTHCIYVDRLVKPSGSIQHDNLAVADVSGTNAVCTGIFGPYP
ncbi:DUF6519 domain-containing protein [Dyella humicola]|uniref:DUF6519 domain-containing protein n=1 Tax=Dyella humicola TaxID=2992126 RepID=UPI002251041E|nr:DUF6519 domain-containing protein [Dyella humicola]